MEKIISEVVYSTDGKRLLGFEFQDGTSLIAADSQIGKPEEITKGLRSGDNVMLTAFKGKEIKVDHKGSLQHIRSVIRVD